MAASTATELHNSDGRTSGEKRRFFRKEELAALIENADFSVRREAWHWKRENGERVRVRRERNYRNRHLNSFLKGVWLAATAPDGAADNIKFFRKASVYSEMAGKCPREVRYLFAQLRDDFKVLTILKGEDRRTTTHQFHPEALERRCRVTSIHSKHSRSSPARQEPVSAPPVIPAAAAPVAVPEHRSTGRIPRKLTPREGPKLVAKMAELMHGVTRVTGEGVAASRGAWELQPDDSRYRAPMLQDKALIAACMTLGIPEDAAREHLKLCCWKFESESGP